MSDQQQRDEALGAVESAIREASDDSLMILKEEQRYEGGGVPFTSGVRLAYALGQLTDDQREALLVGAALSTQKHDLLDGLLSVVSGKDAAPPTQ
jgi:hypothetical protein